MPLDRRGADGCRGQALAQQSGRTRTHGQHKDYLLIFREPVEIFDPATGKAMTYASCQACQVRRTNSAAKGAEIPRNITSPASIFPPAHAQNHNTTNSQSLFSLFLTFNFNPAIAKDNLLPPPSPPAMAYTSIEPNSAIGRALSELIAKKQADGSLTDIPETARPFAISDKLLSSSSPAGAVASAAASPAVQARAALNAVSPSPAGKKPRKKRTAAAAVKENANNANNQEGDASSSKEAGPAPKKRKNARAATSSRARNAPKAPSTPRGSNAASKKTANVSSPLTGPVTPSIGPVTPSPRPVTPAGPRRKSPSAHKAAFGCHRSLPMSSHSGLSQHQLRPLKPPDGPWLWEHQRSWSSHGPATSHVFAQLTTADGHPARRQPPYGSHSAALECFSHPASALAAKSPPPDAGLQQQHGQSRHQSVGSDRGSVPHHGNRHSCQHSSPAADAGHESAIPSPIPAPGRLSADTGHGTVVPSPLPGWLSHERLPNAANVSAGY